MKLTHTLAALAATTLVSQGATMIIDNIAAPSDQAYGEGNYHSQSFTASIAGTGATDNVNAIGAIQQIITLESFSLIQRSNAGGEGTDNPRFLNIYNGATFVGSSTNSEVLRGHSEHGFGDLVTWNFDSLALDKDTQYTVEISGTNVAGDIGSNNRLAARRLAGGSFNAYAGGDNSAGGQDLAFSATFEVTVVPEPSSTALLGLGGLALIMRRRKA